MFYLLGFSELTCIKVEKIVYEVLTSFTYFNFLKLKTIFTIVFFFNCLINYIIKNTFCKIFQNL